jgi:hypothetical protein
MDGHEATERQAASLDLTKGRRRRVRRRGQEGGRSAEAVTKRRSSLRPAHIMRRAVCDCQPRAGTRLTTERHGLKASFAAGSATRAGAPLPFPDPDSSVAVVISIFLGHQRALLQVSSCGKIATRAAAARSGGNCALSCSPWTPAPTLGTRAPHRCTDLTP